MAVFPHLLAKATGAATPREAELLAGHLRAATQVATMVCAVEGEQVLSTLGLDPSAFYPRLSLALPRAALAHDWGKGNDHFQKMVRSPGKGPGQAGWHELFSVWLALHFAPLGQWLFQGCDPVLRHAILAAVIGHHLRLEDTSNAHLDDRADVDLTILAGHAGFGEALRVGAVDLDLGDPPKLADVRIDLLDPIAFDTPMRAWLFEANAWWEAAPPEHRRFTALIKALLIAVDVVASALPRWPADPVDWTREALSRRCTEEMVRDVVRLRLGNHQPRAFQEHVRDSPERVTFVRAGCGSGKTAAAYLWAGRRANGRKLFVCYPTTGTATQGFTDYVPPDEFEAALMHSRVTADLAELLTNGPREGEDHLNRLMRQTGLALWEAPITVCTADTVLGLIQNNRTGLFSSASLALGAFVFDEIHQYDDRLFGALLRFLEAFRGAPTLLMTASLPRHRLAALIETLDRHQETLHIVEGPADLEQLERYRLVAGGPAGVWDETRALVAEGGHVLWVSNTVDRAVDVARRARSAGLSPLPYHSRFRYRDRLRRHHEVVAAFDAQVGGVLAATTQVCEVSLDLSAGLLITDLAPVPALIQRLGRLNRRVRPGGAGQAARAIIIDPPSPAPYRQADLDLAEEWLARLGTGPLSQADLAAAFDQVVTATPPGGRLRSAWLDGGVFAVAAPLREAGLTIPVARAEDVESLAGLHRGEAARALIGLTIPMPLGPVQREIGGWRRLGGALVAPAGRLEYDTFVGGRWR